MSYRKGGGGGRGGGEEGDGGLQRAHERERERQLVCGLFQESKKTQGTRVGSREQDSKQPMRSVLAVVVRWGVLV